MTTLVVSFVPVVAVSYTGTGIYRQQLAVEELVLVKWQLAIRELVLKNLRPKKRETRRSPQRCCCVTKVRKATWHPYHIYDLLPSRFSLHVYKMLAQYPALAYTR